MTHSHSDTTRFCNQILQLQQWYINIIDTNIHCTLRDLEQTERVIHSSSFANRPIDEQDSVVRKKIHLENLYCMLASIKVQIRQIGEETRQCLTDMSLNLHN